MDFIIKRDTLAKIAYYILREKTGYKKEFAKKMDIEEDRFKDFIHVLRIFAEQADAQILYNRLEETYYFSPQGKFTDFEFIISSDNKTDNVPQDVPHHDIKFIKEYNILVKMAFLIQLKQTGTRKEFALKCGLKEPTFDKYLKILKELADEKNAKIIYDKYNNTYYFNPQGFFSNFEFIITVGYQEFNI
jgi:hypothetical protein